jgi:hypothetical protein
MEDEEDKKGLPTLSKYSVKSPKNGDTRKVTRHYPKGHVFSFKEHMHTWKLTENVYMEVTETYSDGWGDGVTTFHTETARPAPPRWKLWLMHPVVPGNLPKAKVVK